jgi:hypothetical protein
MNSLRLSPRLAGGNHAVRRKGSFPRASPGLSAVLFGSMLITAAVWAQSSRDTPAPATQHAAQDGYATQFGVLADRNIFVKSRARPVVRDSRVPATQPEKPPPTAEESLVLRGVVIEDDGPDRMLVLRAYFEDQRNRSLVRVTTGDALARGRVIEVSIDAIAFEGDAGVVWVRIGDNLVGERSNTSTAASTPSTQPATGGDANLSDVERRMRERRQQRNQ